MDNNLIFYWKDTVGLTVDRVEEYLTEGYDEDIEYTIIFFTNGRFVIQRDQSGYGPTEAGLVTSYDYDDAIAEIAKSKKLT
jgi:hypothetical protein